MRVVIGGAEADLLTLEEVLSAVLDCLRDPTARMLCVASANLDHIHHFGLDSGLEGSFGVGRGGARWLVLLDGMPLVWTARRLTGVRWEQLAGSDLLPDLLRTAERARARVGFLGGTTRQHQALATVLAERYPALAVAGFWAPTREVVDDPEASALLAAQIREAAVDLLVVGLGKPRQEAWLLQHGPATGARVALAFGAAADFLAGTAARAPVLLRRAGLEWLFRLVKDPRRLARRYLVQGPASLYRVLRRSHVEGVTDEAARGLDEPMLSSPARWRQRLGRILLATDAAVISIASLLAYQTRGALGELGVVVALAREVPAAIGVLPLWLAILYLFGCYRPQHLSSGGEAFRRFVAATTGGVLALGFISFALNLQLSRGYVVLLYLFVLLLGGAARGAVREYLRRQRARGRFLQNVVVVGTDDEAVQIAEAMDASAVAGYRVVGFLDDEAEIGAAVGPGAHVLGRPEDVLDVAYDQRAGLVLVSPTGVRPGTLRDLTIILEGSPVDLAVAPSLFQVVTRRVTTESVGNIPILHVDQIRLTRGKALLKRSLDVVGALVLLVLLAPITVAAGVAVRATSPGPALFRQTRVGKDGRHFTLLKFRTMVADAEDRLDEVAELNEAGQHFFKIRDDPRVTRVGRFLRKWSIDETPQLWNVLRGHMSLVGPRPPVPAEVEQYEPWHLRRLRVRPGITGVWQVSGRSNVPFDEAVRMDVFYIENWSLGYDLFVLAKTVVAVLGRRGAY